MCGGFVAGQVAERMACLPVGVPCAWRRAQAGLVLPYHLGRLTTYAALGAAAASPLALFARTPVFSRLSGLILGASAVLLFARVVSARAGGAGSGSLVPQWIGRLTGRAVARSGRARGYTLGLALGFLPCGFLYGALLAAASTGRPWLGAASMLAFGLGTVPVLALLGLASQATANRWRRNLARVTAPLLTLNAALLFWLATSQLVRS